jgi:hypothetical protein
MEEIRKYGVWGNLPVSTAATCDRNIYEQEE